MILKTILAVLGFSPQYVVVAHEGDGLVGLVVLVELVRAGADRGARRRPGSLKPSPSATTLLASPAFSAVGDCIEKESSDRMVGNFEVDRVMLMTAVEASLASQHL